MVCPERKKQAPLWVSNKANRPALPHPFLWGLVGAVGLVVSCLVYLQSTVLAEPFSNPVVPRATLGYRHGTFPALPDDPLCKPFGGCTHAGVDLLIPEGCPPGHKVYAFADGRVQEIVKEGQPEYQWAGNAVVIWHPSSLLGAGGQSFYTLYLHMRNAPLVKVNDLMVGGETVLGEVGKTGAAGNRCHTHFEIRRFAYLISPFWKNIYGFGDQRNDFYFKTFWLDPVPMFATYPSGLKEATPPPKQEEKASASQESQADILSSPAFDPGRLVTKWILAFRAGDVGELVDVDMNTLRPLVKEQQTTPRRDWPTLRRRYREALATWRLALTRGLDALKGEYCDGQVLLHRSRALFDQWYENDIDLRSALVYAMILDVNVEFRVIEVRALSATRHRVFVEFLPHQRASLFRCERRDVRSAVVVFEVSDRAYTVIGSQKQMTVLLPNKSGMGALVGGVLTLQIQY